MQKPFNLDHATKCDSGATSLINGMDFSVKALQVTIFNYYFNVAAFFTISAVILFTSVIEFHSIIFSS